MEEEEWNAEEEMQHIKANLEITYNQQLTRRL